LCQGRKYASVPDTGRKPLGEGPLWPLVHGRARQAIQKFRHCPYCFSSYGYTIIPVVPSERKGNMQIILNGPCTGMLVVSLAMAMT
jgi:hypothetical protein